MSGLPATKVLRAKRPRGLHRLDAFESVTFEWLTELNDTDLGGVVALLDEIALSSGTNGYATPLDAPEIERLAAKLRLGLALGTTHQLVMRAEPERTIVGVATVQCVSQPTRRHIVELKRVAISARHRGRFLLRGRHELVRKCHEMGWEVIQIDVSERGPVLLWKRMGFQIFGEIADYAREQGRKIQGYFMALRVPPPRRLRGRASNGSPSARDGSQD